MRVEVDLEKYMDSMVFDEMYESEFYGTTTLYLTGPKELLIDEYPDAESAEIAIEFVTKNPDAYCPAVTISPTKDGSDYDWVDLYLPKETMDKLLDIGLRRGKK